MDELDSKIRVLVVDDSAVMRKIIISALEKESSIKVIGFAANGLQAIDSVRNLKPDILTLDIEMPVMDGLTALKEIRKENRSLPIIMFSTLTHKGAQAAVMALTAGASDYVGKPTTSAGSIDGAFKVLENELIPKIVGLARRAKLRKTAPPRQVEPPLRPSSLGTVKDQVTSSPVAKPEIRSSLPVRPASAVCIGVSTGGPMALMQVFGQFSAPLSVPVFIVQHMPPTFTALLAARLSSTGLMTVKEGEDGEIVVPGMAYIAPGGFHMILSQSGANTVIRLNTDAPENSCRPAVDPLFRSAAEIYGSNLLGVVLTGMGYDGLKGAQVIKSKFGQVIAQDEETSVIWGMPGAIVQAGIADTVLPIEKMADEITYRTRKVSTSR
jgi:two-component system chemotaxis response regulator CheB